MNKQDRELLLKDLCSRLPYGVKYQTYLGDIFTLKGITLDRTTTQYYIDDNAFSLSQIKPYLRPISSMTDEEKQELRDKNILIAVSTTGTVETTIGGFDWLNKSKFDYRGLIENGLALESPEGMYNIK